MNWNWFKKQKRTIDITINQKDPPSLIEFRWGDYGPVSKLIWMNDKNRVHRTTGPAIVRYFDDIIILEFFNDGLRNKLDGPAVVRYNYEDFTGYFQYWKDGNFLKEEQFYDKNFKLSAT